MAKSAVEYTLKDKNAGASSRSGGNSDAHRPRSKDGGTVVKDESRLALL